MSEKKFLCFMLTEGIILLILGLGIIILPKISPITLGIMLCLAFFTYGIYKITNAVFTKNYIRHYIYNIVLGGILTALGLFFFFLPMPNLAVISVIVGLYLIAESISSKAFAFQTKNNFQFWQVCFILSMLQCLSGIIIILVIPTVAFLFVGTLTGINFLISGMALIGLYLSNTYSY